MMTNRNIHTGLNGETCACLKRSEVWDYRDLHCLNLAMLAKQCWSLISEPDFVRYVLLFVAESTFL
jgi:hypothetical protein